MKPNTIKTQSMLDRVATADEVRRAVLPYPDPTEEFAAEIVHEVVADVGGYIRIPAAEFEASLMMLELTGAQDGWVN